MKKSVASRLYNCIFIIFNQYPKSYIDLLITDYQSYVVWFSVFSFMTFLLYCSKMKGDLQRTVCHRLSRWNLFGSRMRIVDVVNKYI